MIKIKLLREGKLLHPLEDFLVEISWWQKRGVGTNFSKEQLAEAFNQGMIKEMHPHELDEVPNCYNKLIQGNTREEKFESMFRAYLKDRRGPEEQRAQTDEGKRVYLEKLMEAVENRKCPPPVIVEVDNVGRFMTGGRTRAALAKVADVPILIRSVNLPESSIVEKNLFINTLYKTKIEEQNEKNRNVFRKLV